MKSPTATFFGVREKGKNAPLPGDNWTHFWDVTEKAVADLGDRFEAVRITVEPLDEEAKKTTVTAERDYWRRVAAYLASCHAATAYGVLDRKSGSKAEKRRHLSLMEVCVSMLKGIWPNGKLQPNDITSEIKRCQDCHDHYKDKTWLTGCSKIETGKRATFAGCPCWRNGGSCKLSGRCCATTPLCSS